MTPPIVISIYAAMTLGSAPLFAQDIPPTLPATSPAIDAPTISRVLVQTIPQPPPTQPSQSRVAAGITAIANLFGDVGPLFNSTVVFSAFRARFDAELARGLTDADRLGQKGVLIKSEVMQENSFTGPMYSLYESGATLIGVGPSADDVCVANRCYMNLGGPEQGKQWVEGMGYIWISRRSDGKLLLDFLDRKALQSRAEQVWLNSQLRASVQEQARSSAISGYANALTKRLDNRKSQIMVHDLLKSRDDAILRMDATEKQLKIEMERSRRARQVSGNIDSLIAAFGIANAAKIAAESIGQSMQPTAGTSLTSKAGLEAWVREIEASSGKKVDALSVEMRKTISDRDSYERRIIDIGISYGMDPRGESVFKGPVIVMP